MSIIHLFINSIDSRQVSHTTIVCLLHICVSVRPYLVPSSSCFLESLPGAQVEPCSSINKFLLTDGRRILSFLPLFLCRRLDGLGGQTKVVRAKRKPGKWPGGRSSPIGSMVLAEWQFFNGL